MALHLASKVIHGTGAPLAGLTSSIKVTNPQLFGYLMGPVVLISNTLGFVSCCIAGLVGAAMFAVLPWAVIYSRKIWTQDFVPVFATSGSGWMEEEEIVEDLDGVKDHRPVEPRQEVLVGDFRQRIQPRPQSAGKDDAFHTLHWFDIDGLFSAKRYSTGCLSLQDSVGSLFRHR